MTERNSMSVVRIVFSIIDVGLLQIYEYPPVFSKMYRILLKITLWVQVVTKSKT